MPDQPTQIIVRSAVHTAGQRMMKEAAKDKRGLTDWNLAEEQRDLCRDRGDIEEADFWHEVFEYLMTIESVAAGTPVKIID